MVKSKKIVVLFIVAVLMLSTLSTSFASDISNAKKLNALGLLEDTSDKSLNESLSRMIGLTMILKSLGYTSESVIARAADCPFTDIPEWFKGWAAIAIDMDITAGVSKTKFDPNARLTQKMFYVFQLRALGYDKDTAWRNTETTAVSAGLIKKGVSLNAKAFTKRDASEVMFTALGSTVQDSGMKLIDKLVNDNVIDEGKAAAAGFKTEPSGLKEGKTITIKNAYNVKLSYNGKILIWQDAYIVSYNEKDGKLYNINPVTGEKFTDGYEKNYIRGMDLETGKKFVVGDADKSNYALSISSDGKTVVFSESDPKKTGKIYGINLDTGKKFLILDSIDKKQNWHVSPSGTMIFWHTNNTGKMINWDNDLYAKNWETGEEYVISEAEQDQYLEDMTPDGKTVIWTDYRNWDEYKKLYIDIYGRNLDTGEEFIIKDGPMVFEYSMVSRNRFYPSMTPDGKIIVYSRDREDIFPTEIYGINIETGEEFVICDDGKGYKQSPIISDNGEIVVWEDNRNAENGRPGEFSYDNTDIFGKNLKTGEELAIGIMAGKQTNAKISADGKIVVWQDLNNAQNNWNIYGKNLETGEDLVICDDKGNQVLNTLSPDGKIVIWQQGADIYVKSITQ